MLSIRSRLGLSGAVLLAAAVTAGCGITASPAASPVARVTETPRPAETDPPEDFPTQLRELREIGPIPANAPRTSAEPYDRLPLTRTARPGQLDPTFGTRGVTLTRFAGKSYGANGLTVLPGGAIVAAGGDANDQDGEFVLVKYHCDGTLDRRFGDRGRVVTPIPLGMSGGARAVATTPLGKLVTVGIAGLGQPEEYGFVVARHLPDGRLDRSFGGDGIVVAPVGPIRRSGADGVVVLKDGRILVVGGASDAQRNPSFAAARFLPDGRLDPSFGDNGSVLVPMPGGDASGFALVVQKNGRIVLAGTAANEGVTSFALTRLTRNGRLDRSFGNNGIVLQAFPDTIFNGAHDVVLDRKGRIVVAGSTGNEEHLGDFALMRFRPNGSLDPSFGGGTGMVRTTFEGVAGISSVLVRPDGGLVAAGQAWPNIALVGYRENGDLDRRFGDEGRTITSVRTVSAASGVALQFNRRIVIAGLAGNETLSDSSFLTARYGLLPGRLPRGCQRTPSVNGLG